MTKSVRSDLFAISFTSRTAPRSATSTSVVPLLILQLLVVTLPGCGSGSSGTSGPTLSSEFIMPADNLPAALKKPGVVLLSVQGDGQISNPGFVNNAVPVDESAIREFSETPGAFASVSGWEQMFGALGITTRNEVILYDDGELKFASRVRFLLYYFGVRKTFIVNGGYNAMQPLVANGQLTTTLPGTPTPATFVVKIQNNPIHLIDQQDVLAILGNPTVSLVDVRTPQEYEGCVTIPPVPPSRGGHIPGARNLPVESLLTPQSNDPAFSFLDSPPDLRQIFQNFGLQTNGKIYVYCHDGAKSSLAASAMADAGYTDVSLYYLSYLNWQAIPSDPIETVSPCTP